MIGEINGSSTLSETPSPAIMKANSPICARLNPDLMEVFSGSPDKSTPNEEKMALPIMVTSVMMMTGQAYSTNTVRIHQHTDRNEKDSSEEIFYRLYDMFDMFGLDGFGKDRSHDKCS